MNFLPAYPARNPGLLWAWTPDLLGASLLAWWDAERADLITTAGGAVTSWADSLYGYAATQGTAGSRPTYNATGFNGRPVVTFDGVDDELTYAATTGLPVGSSACEVWAVADQTALVADATIRNVFSYGGVATGGGRILRRQVVGGTTNRASVAVGDGTTAFASINGSVDFSGRHIARGVITATDSRSEVDSATVAATSVVPSTGTTRTRLGANTANTAASFWQGGLNSLLVTSALSAGQATALYGFLNARR